ncbi:hypothetical protein K2173_018325 [Erythroxylum novogranatense]|uniref:Uncharacterized protein n=1 Tax=Erythroxylum novogranatense TaxID=1862640 RepID=A0AAV8UEU8_9ROSI|nr:hypothetical protein K2173_018325 [Erythroxylum novogranatense]
MRGSHAGRLDAKRGLTHMGRDLKLVVFPNPYREDPDKAYFDNFLLVGAIEVFVVAFALLLAVSVILTLNVLLLVSHSLSFDCFFFLITCGGHIIFFQSLSLFGYCLFPLDIGALICLLKDNVVLKVIVVLPIHEFSSQSQKKGPCTLSRLFDVCIYWLSYHCH